MQMGIIDGEKELTLKLIELLVIIKSSLIGCVPSY